MIDLSLWKSILGFIKEYKELTETTGILICGSLTRGNLRSGSDIDILLLQNKFDFEMEVLHNDNYPIDRLQASPKILESILQENSNISNILSLSFGSSKIIIEDSPQLRKIIEIAEKNIFERKLSYTPPMTKDPHIVDGAIFTVRKTDLGFDLLKNNEIITL